MKYIANGLVVILVLLLGGWMFAPQQEVITEVQIDATPDKVWAVLQDFENYGTWNPFLPAIEGEMLTGETIAITFDSQTFGKTLISPTLLNVTPGEAFRWKGMLLMPGMFDGEHFFRLEAHNGGTRFIHGEAFSGLLLWFVDMNVMATDFDAMNNALAKEVSRRG